MPTAVPLDPLLFAVGVAMLALAKALNHLGVDLILTACSTATQPRRCTRG
jgi:hypothetical protein